MRKINSRLNKKYGKLKKSLKQNYNMKGGNLTNIINEVKFYTQDAVHDIVTDFTGSFKQPSSSVLDQPFLP